jgi:hypothetical protein
MIPRFWEIGCRWLELFVDHVAFVDENHEPHKQRHPSRTPMTMPATTPASFPEKVPNCRTNSSPFRVVTAYRWEPSSGHIMLYNSLQAMVTCSILWFLSKFFANLEWKKPFRESQWTNLGATLTHYSTLRLKDVARSSMMCQSRRSKVWMFTKNYT